MARLSEAELERRVLDGIAAEIELFGTAAPTSRVLRLDGVVASVCPATPDRSIFNSVYAADPAALEGKLDDLARIYDEAGVRAWTVWLPGEHPAGRELLEPRGHFLDSSPRAMALELSDLQEPRKSLPEGVALVPGDPADMGRINDLAYGMAPPAWGAAMTGPMSLPVYSRVAVWDAEPVACATAIDVGDDTAITAVATLPERMGNGLAGRIIHSLLEDAMERGARTGSLQASAAGAPVYERLGFRDVGWVALWEHRTAPATLS